LKSLTDRSKSAEGGRVFGEDVVRFIFENFGQRYTTSSVYNIMHELGLNWITSRSVHPKSDKQLQVNFKKNFKEGAQSGARGR
jgi:transposase